MIAGKSRRSLKILLKIVIYRTLNEHHLNSSVTEFVLTHDASGQAGGWCPRSGKREFGSKNDGYHFFSILFPLMLPIGLEASPGEGTRHTTCRGMDLHFRDDKVLGTVNGHPLWAIYNCGADIVGTLDIGGTYHDLALTYHRDGDQLITGTFSTMTLTMGNIEKTGTGSCTMSRPAKPRFASPSAMINRKTGTPRIQLSRVVLVKTTRSGWSWMAGFAPLLPRVSP